MNHGIMCGCERRVCHETDGWAELRMEVQACRCRGLSVDWFRRFLVGKRRYSPLLSAVTVESFRRDVV